MALRAKIDEVVLFPPWCRAQVGLFPLSCYGPPGILWLGVKGRKGTMGQAEKKPDRAGL